MSGLGPVRTGLLRSFFFQNFAGPEPDCPWTWQDQGLQSGPNRSWSGPVSVFFGPMRLEIEPLVEKLEHAETIRNGPKCDTARPKGLRRPVRGVPKVTEAPNEGDRGRTRDHERELGLGVKEGNNSMSTTTYKGVYKLQRHEATK